MSLSNFATKGELTQGQSLFKVKTPEDTEMEIAIFQKGNTYFLAKKLLKSSGVATTLASQVWLTTPYSTINRLADSVQEKYLAPLRQFISPNFIIEGENSGKDPISTYSLTATDKIGLFADGSGIITLEETKELTTNELVAKIYDATTTDRTEATATGPGNWLKENWAIVAAASGVLALVGYFAGWFKKGKK